jgi:hypothetical protein
VTTERIVRGDPSDASRRDLKEAGTVARRSSGRFRTGKEL